MILKLFAKSSLAAMVLAVAGGSALADDIYLRSGPQAAELPIKNISNLRMKDGELYFTVGTTERHRPIAEVRLELTGDTAFNNAEKAFSDARTAKDDAAAKAKYGDAVTGYANTVGSTNKPWLKEFAALRKQIAANRSGRLDLAIETWLSMLEKEPVAASKSKPSVDGVDPKSKYLSDAAKLLESKEKSTGKVDVRRAMLEMLEEIEKAMGDNDAAMKTLETRSLLGGTPEEIAEVMVRIAQGEAAAKKYDAALERLKKVNLALLSDSGRATAMYIMAEGRQVKLQPTSPVDEWKDLAVDYMKVVSGFPTSPNAGDALLKVAEIHETLKDPDTALKVYRQVAREHANTPAGQAAQKSVERLGR